MIEEAVIAGCGPVGCLCAVLLARQGIKSQVYEKRPKPERKPDATDSQAYLVGLNAGSLITLKASGLSLDALYEASGGYDEMKLYSQSGILLTAIDMPLAQDKPSMVRAFRDEIARHLIDEAMRLHPDDIEFHFEKSISGVNFAKKTVQLTGESEETEVSYDLLVGADGAHSKVRAALEQEMEPGFQTQFDPGMLYASSSIQASTGTFPHHALFHLHNMKDGAIGLNGRGDGDMRIAMMIHQTLADQISAGHTAEFKEKTKKLQVLQNVNEVGLQALHKLIDSTPSFYPITGWAILSQLYGPSTVLLGDAAHTITPVMGQGCNAGLEDARLFAEVLQQTSKDLDRALVTYNAQRRPDIEALVTINEIAIYEYQSVWRNNASGLHKLWILCHSRMMTMHRILGMVLMKLFPRLFGPPELMQAMTGHLPWRRVLPAVRRDAFLLLSGLAACSLGIYKMTLELMT